MTRFSLLGIDDEVTTCECCGRSNLKCTVVLAVLDADGNAEGEVRYGRDCGARALGRGSVDSRKQRRAAEDVEKEARRLVLAAIQKEVLPRWTTAAEEIKDKRGRSWGKLFRLSDGRTFLRFTYVIDTPEAAAKIIPGTWSRLAESFFVGKLSEGG